MSNFHNRQFEFHSALIKHSGLECPACGNWNTEMVNGFYTDDDTNEMRLEMHCDECGNGWEIENHQGNEYGAY